MHQQTGQRWVMKHMPCKGVHCKSGSPWAWPNALQWRYQNSYTLVPVTMLTCTVFALQQKYNVSRNC